MSERQSGVLKFWRSNDSKRFGFITPDNGGADAFVSGHAFDEAGIENPAVGDRLTFTIAQNRDGRDRALSLRREGDEDAAERVFSNAPRVRYEPVRQ